MVSGAPSAPAAPRPFWHVVLDGLRPSSTTFFNRYELLQQRQGGSGETARPVSGTLGMTDTENGAVLQKESWSVRM